MSRDPDSLYHTTEALTALNTALENLAVPLFGINAQWDELLVSRADNRRMAELERQLDLAREAKEHLTRAREALRNLKQKLILP